jgi:regulator of protease activity HflC (stomatin/prohibitin superfamily)
MEAALSWIGTVVEWFGQFIPRFTIVPPTHGAIRYNSRSRVTTALTDGWHFYWPALHYFQSYPVKNQTADLRPQKLTTKDDKTVLVGALVSYEIIDVEAILAHTWDAEDTTRDRALRAVTRVVLSHTWEELKQEARRGTLDTKLKHQAQKALDSYGVKVTEMSLTDLTLTRVFSLVQSTNQIT